MATNKQKIRCRFLSLYLSNHVELIHGLILIESVFNLSSKTSTADS